MKIISSLLFAVLVNCIYAQNVFDCTNNVSLPTQTTILANDNYYGSCIEFSTPNTYNFSGNLNKGIEAANYIELKKGFQAGALTNGGEMNFTIGKQVLTDIKVMNYPDLTAVERYKKLELGINLPIAIKARIQDFINQQGTVANRINPFMEWDLDVEANFIHIPTGTQKKVDGFYFLEFAQDVVNDDWSAIASDRPMRIRFSPPHVGEWVCQIKVNINEGESVLFSDWFRFNVINTGAPGYVKVHPNNKNLMLDGQMIFPVGHNFPHPTEGAVYMYHDGPNNTTNFPPNMTHKATKYSAWQTYKQRIEEFAIAGGRYIRTIQYPVSSLIEFEKKGNYYDRLHYAWEQDKLLELCELHGVKIMMNLMAHSPMMKFADYYHYDWDWDNYNYFNGTFDTPVYPNYCYNDQPPGVKQPHEMFLIEDDLKHHEQRTRYYIARYGYSTSIYEFELLSEPFHINELWIDANNPPNPIPSGILKPYNQDESLIQATMFDAIENYHERMANFIKGHLGHSEHLVGINTVQYKWSPDSPIFIDGSFTLGNVDIVGLNLYLSYPFEDVWTKCNNPYATICTDGDNNEINLQEKTTYHKVNDFHITSNKPIIISEGGQTEELNNCSNFTQQYVRNMSMGFNGVCGFNNWQGWRPSEFVLWEPTIRAEQHMNADVIQTLSQGNGNWVQGRQKEKCNIGAGDAKETQYYISNNKELAVGYVYNRTYNAHSKRNNFACLLDLPYPLQDEIDISWNDGPNLKIEGLKQNTDYQIDWYSFKEGWYLESDCQSTGFGSTSFTLKHPQLITTFYDRPVVWFVLKQQNCQSALISDNSKERIDINTNEKSELTNSTIDAQIANSIEIFPNPFENKVIIKSELSDKILIYTSDGSFIFSKSIQEGQNELNLSGLSNGIYIIHFQNQNKRFKLIKV